MARTANEQVLMTVGPFSGIDATNSPYLVDPSHATASQNVVPDVAYNEYVSTKGRLNASNLTLPGLVRNNPFKFVIQGQLAQYLFGTDNGLYAASLGSNPVQLDSRPSKAPAFCSYGDWAFYTSQRGPGYALKVDKNLNVTDWQLQPPSGAPTVAPGGSGNLLGTYQWVYTFSNATQESSPSPLSASLAVNGTSVTISGFSQAAQADYGNITGINIYRIGGTLSEFLLVGTVAYNPTAANPTPPASFPDNLADANVTGQSLVEHRDPPQPFNAIVTYQDRIWGLGYNSNHPYTNCDIWYSNYAEPWGWDDVNQVIPCGRNLGGDFLVTGCALGSFLFILKQETAWAMIGNDETNFVIEPLFNVGCISDQSLATGYGIAFWLSAQGVWSFDGNTLTNISDGLEGENSSIKAVLDTYSRDDFRNATGFVYDRMYGISFPTQNVTWLYYIPTKQWYSLGWASPSILYDLENVTDSNAPLNQVLGVRNLSASSATVDVWFASNSDLGNAITGSWTSGIATMGAPGDTKQIRHVCLVADTNPGSVTVTVTLNPGLGEQTFSRTFNLAQAPIRKLASLPPNMMGFTGQVTVSSTSYVPVKIAAVQLLGNVKRSNVIKG